MMQRHVPHSPGMFAPCDQCKREPKHVLISGRSSSEPIDFRNQSPQRHALECSPCGRSTGRHAELNNAVAEWGAAYAQGTLPLRVIHGRRRSATG